MAGIWATLFGQIQVLRNFDSNWGPHSEQCSKGLWDSSSPVERISFSFGICAKVGIRKPNIVTVLLSPLLCFSLKLDQPTELPKYINYNEGNWEDTLTPLDIPVLSFMCPIGDACSALSLGSQLFGMEGWEGWGRRGARGQHQSVSISEREPGPLNCLHCSSRMGPVLPLPLDFLSVLPISLDEITACTELLGAPLGSTSTSWLC